MSRSIKVLKTVSRELADGSIDETQEELVVHPGHWLYRIFRQPGNRAFVPSAAPTVRFTAVKS